MPRRILVLTLIALFGVACSSTPIEHPPVPAHPALAATGPYGWAAEPSRRPMSASAPSFNDFLLDAAHSFGQASYLWQGDGVTRELRYQGTLIATPHAPAVCHCVGATLQVYFTAFEAWDARFGGSAGVLGGLGVPQVQQLKKHWYVSTDDLTGVRGALTSVGLGTPVDDLRMAQAGDLVQFWRENGSGHSALLDRFDFDASGAPTAITYFSCQSNGANFNTEPVGQGDRPVDPARIHVVRPTPPVPVPPEPSPPPDAGPSREPQPQPTWDQGVPTRPAPAPPPSNNGASGSCALAEHPTADDSAAWVVLLLLLVGARRRPRAT